MTDPTPEEVAAARAVIAAFEAVKPDLPDAVDTLRAGLRDVARRLVVTADLNWADVPKGE